MPLITCQNLTLGYDGREIIQNLSFTVSRGDYLCIVGVNGAGKSTLMRTILGLQKPIAGQVLTGDGLRPSQIGYLPQQTPVQKDFPASVLEVVLSGFEGSCGWRPYYTKAEKARARENIHIMGLDALAGHCYRELSGGQQQRVLLARALCATDTLLFLDEPVSGLDPKVTGEMYDLIEKLNREKGITIIMISHDLAAALRFSSHILHIGDTVFFGTNEEYRQSGVARQFTRGGDTP
jgi:zinc transport system ATP-binding protein